MPLQRIKRYVADILADDSPEDIVYDPVHVAVVLVSCLAGVGALYWMLWALFVCEGGLFTKIIPAAQVLLTDKTLQDFGYQGYPYQLGIFEGWIVNVGGLVVCLLAVAGAWFFHGKIRRRFPLDPSPQ